MKEVQLREDGLLWLINRCLFHRVGYSLGISTGDPGLAGSFWLNGDGAEEWEFDPAISREAEIRTLLGDAAVDKLLANVGPESQAPIP